MSDDPASHRSSAQSLPVMVLMAAPLLSYFWLVARYGVNIPHADDFDALLAFLCRSPLHVGDFFLQHNEHRMLWTRLVGWTCHQVTGTLDLRLLMWVGNAAVVGLLAVLARTWRSRHLPAMHFLPVAFILLEPQSWANMTWAMAGLQNLYVLLFAALSISCWQIPSVGWQFIALFWATLAVYTSGNGMLVLLVLSVWQGVRCIDQYLESRSSPAAGPCASTQLSSTRPAAGSSPVPAGVPNRFVNTATLLVLLGFTSVLLVVYFIGYKKPAHHPAITKTLMAPSQLIQHVIVLCGAYVGDLGRRCAFVAGMAQIACFLLLTSRRYDRRNPVVYYLLMFCLGSMLVVSLCRAGFGVHQALISRYRVLPLLSLALNYFAIYELWPERTGRPRVFASIMVVLTIAHVATFVVAERGLRHRTGVLVAGLRQWRENGQGLGHPSLDRADKVLRAALERGVYRLPP